MTTKSEHPAEGPETQEGVKALLKGLKAKKAFGLVELEGGAIIVLDYGCTPGDRAGSMYQLKKLVDAELASTAINYLKHQAEVEAANAAKGNGPADQTNSG